MLSINSTDGPPDQAFNADGRYRWWVLTMLATVYFCHSIDRQILSVAVEGIKAEFHLTDKAIGVLGGVAYTVAFAIASLPVGWLIDRLKRVLLLAIMLCFWSALTFGAGLATGFIALLIIRIGVGLAEAGAQPACLSLISDYFAPTERGFAFSCFYLSSALGIAFSFLVGSWIVGEFGWRAAFLIAGIPGLAIALALTLFVVEPQRGVFDKGDPSIPASVKTVLKHFVRERALFWLTIAMTVSSLTLSAIWLWALPFLMRLHDVKIDQAGWMVAAAALAQASGSFSAGRLAVHYKQRGFAPLALVPLVSAILSVPCAFGFAYAESLTGAVACLIITTFLMGGYLGPAFGLAMSLVTSGMRGISGSILQMMINLFGSGVGPLLVGTFSDYIGGAHSLRPALAITLSLNLLAALLYFLVYHSLQDHEGEILTSG